MRLYSYCRSSASYRVRIALALKNIPYEYAVVDISQPISAQAEQSYGQVNPMRQVPVLEWRDADNDLQRLTQSVAIIEYLEQRFPNPPLFASDPLGRARQREAVEVVNAGIQPLHNSKTIAMVQSAAGQEQGERFRQEVIARGLVVLEALAQRHAGPFFMGVIPSVADVFIIPQLYGARRFGVEVSTCPRLVEIESHALDLEAFRSAHPSRQPDAPAAERKAP